MEYILIGIAHLALCTFFQMVSFEVFKNMGKPYSKKDFIDHLAEDLHSVVGIKIYDDK